MTRDDLDKINRRLRALERRQGDYIVLLIMYAFVLICTLILIYVRW